MKVATSKYHKRYLKETVLEISRFTQKWLTLFCQVVKPNVNTSSAWGSFQLASSTIVLINSILANTCLFA